jgi:hypothetical protein
MPIEYLKLYKFFCIAKGVDGSFEGLNKFYRKHKGKL